MSEDAHKENFEDSCLTEAQVEEAAREVIAGTDSILVPEDLVSEDAELPRERTAAEARSLFVQIQDMSATQKVKLALKGNRDARMILIRGTNLLVVRRVLENPRISDDEILMLAKSRNIETVILSMISKNKSWIAAYAVRAALVENPKTPVAIAFRFISTLQNRDIRNLAKSKNIPAAVCAQAKKIVFARTGARG